MAQVLRALLDHVLHQLSRLSPRNPCTWVFLGWRRSREREVFIENPKYEFLYVTKHMPHVRPVWIGQDRAICTLLREHGYEAYPRHSLRGIYFSLTAGYTFVGGFLKPENWRYSGGTKLIQLWHSKSLKKTGFESPYGLGRYDRFVHASLFTPVYRFIAVSEFLSKFVSSDFRIPRERLLVTGIPKHDVLLGPVEGAEIDVDENLAVIIEEARGQDPARLILYGPTFRPDGTNPLKDLDLVTLNERLAAQNDIMVISLHPKFSVRDWIPKDAALTHIRFSQNDKDTYPLLSNFDVLVTDYSSLAFDFLLMGKPVIHYAFDFHTFREGMGVYEELWDVMPGPKAFTFEELLTVLQEDLRTYQGRTEKARDVVFSHRDGDAAGRIARAVYADASAKS